MFSVFVISLREFLEAFLIIGIFLGISKKLQLKREKEIWLAATIGIFLSLLLSISVFYLGKELNLKITESNLEKIESLLMILSGIFIAQIITSLHSYFVKSRAKEVIKAHKNLSLGIFDLSLFTTIIFLVVREGFEVALFSASTILFSTFIENLFGLMIGFLLSFVLSTLVFISYVRFSINSLYRITEQLMIFLGAAFIKNGLVKIFNEYLNINIKSILPINIGFLPEKESIVGHFLNNLFGLEKNLSLIAVLIIIFYYIIVSYLVNKRIKKV